MGATNDRAQGAPELGRADEDRQTVLFVLLYAIVERSPESQGAQPGHYHHKIPDFIPRLQYF